MYRACIIVMSDKEYTGEEEDLNSNKVIEYLKKQNFDIIVHNIVPEVKSIVKRSLLKCCDEYEVDLVVLIGSKELADNARYEIEDEINFPQINYWISDDKDRYVSSRGKTAVIQMPEIDKKINLDMNKVIEAIEYLNNKDD